MSTDKKTPSDSKIPSKKKIAANRRNAKLSTGPRSKRGQFIVSFNAIKHAIFADCVVVKHGKMKERQADFDRILSNLISVYNPQNAWESYLVDSAAGYMWRHRRIINYESASFEKEFDMDMEGVKARAVKSLSKFRFGIIGNKWPPELELSKVNIKFVLDSLCEIISDMEPDKKFSLNSQKKLNGIFGGTPNSFATTIRIINKEFEEMINGKEGLFDRIMRKTKIDGNEKANFGDELILDNLKIVRDEFQELLDKYEELEADEIKNEEARLKDEVYIKPFPDMKFSESILKREAFLQKGIHKAIRELEKLRQGEPIE